LTPITYRQQAIMQQFQLNMAYLTAIRNGTVGTPADVLPRATMIQQIAMSLPGAFPANSGGEGSRALPAIPELARRSTRRNPAALPGSEGGRPIREVAYRGCPAVIR
jgi:hypothetical protein